MKFERANELFSYDRASGVLTWKQSRGKASAGTHAGVADYRGYIVIGADGKRHYAHRIAWLLATGVHPAGVIDHINGDRANNSIANLRDVSTQVNLQNQREPSQNSKSGLLGVRAFGKKYRAQISVNGTSAHLGTFASPQEAHAAYIAAKRIHHAGCTL